MLPARTTPTPILTVIPSVGHRVCLYDAILDQRHDHGTVLEVACSPKGRAQALVRWDDEPEAVPPGWCDLDAIRLKCPTREQNTRGNYPRSDER
jgi:hypothetical protein